MQLIFTLLFFFLFSYFYHFSIIVYAHVHHYIAFFFFFFSSRDVTDRLFMSWPNLEPFYLVPFDQGRTLVLLAFLGRDIYDNSSRTRTIFLILLFFPRGKEERKKDHFPLLSLSHPLIPFHPSTPPPPFPSSPSSSPPPFSFLLCPTSQLYTLAVATSIVYFKTPQTRKNQSASFSSFFFSSFYCNEK